MSKKQTTNKPTNTVKAIAKKVVKAMKSVKTNFASMKPADVLNRKQAAEFLNISIYAVDQSLLKKQLKDLTFGNIKKFKPAK